MTKSDLQQRVYFWSEIYIEWADRFFNLEIDSGKKEYQEFKVRQYEARKQIRDAIDLLRG